MSGNVWEWCADWYDGKAYERYKRGDLAAPGSGEGRVLRGGSWSLNFVSYFRCAYRLNEYPANRDLIIGFRCARTP